jgi:molybdenum cofactor cytidylyltransferase
MNEVGAIVLAAGSSSRLGQPKQLLEFNGEALVHSGVRAAVEGGCEIVCVVTGAERETVERAIADFHPLLVHNGEWARGVGSSIRVGVQRLCDCAAVVLLTCDQPAVDAGIIESLIEQHRKTGRPVVASHYADTLGIPALFHRSLFPELERLPDTTGAKGLIEMDPGRVAKIEFPEGAIDIDSPGDLQAWQRTRRGQPARY